MSGPAGCICIRKHLADAFNDPRDVNPECPVHGPRLAAAVPRRAVFDDLRVGQWVVWLCGSSPTVVGGEVTNKTGETLTFQEPGTGNLASTPWFVPQSHVERGEVTILRDAPAPPVTVRREDLERFAAMLEEGNHAAPAGSEFTSVSAKWLDLLKDRARVLIDNADTGATP